jgi:hypothetical protein
MVVPMSPLIELMRGIVRRKPIIIVPKKVEKFEIEMQLKEKKKEIRTKKDQQEAGQSKSTHAPTPAKP